ncbi:hypothetical protein AURANDRAFT_70683 [Aureococcus anophagefferens]|uniref:Uncharacterized protein n=1 Tax=Aureococcus anophagefferens TaxID=44056 RepID=F0XZ91_AURAN|nr:hypothetical protein AURANDRAFT_70683 [Aureococcus anophagefferens]EGB11897.1 hypothetical protein AURANDRAFT_70683 [Aureococcus anophagefferens]|eukprot:XP_009033013.1 hypothetical protein AURANDRAFT_70683 [Aureococcus anophagefferens]
MDLGGRLTPRQARQRHDDWADGFPAEVLAWQAAGYPGTMQNKKMCHILYDLVEAARNHVNRFANRRADGTSAPLAWTSTTLAGHKQPGQAFDVVIGWLVAQDWKCAYSQMRIAHLGEITLDRGDQLAGPQSLGYVDGNVHVVFGCFQHWQGNTTYANSDSCTVNFDFVFDVAKTQQARCALSGIPLKAESLPPLDSSTQTYPRKVSPERPDDNDRGYHEHNFYLVLACFNAHLVFGWGKWTKFMIDVLWFEYGVPPPVELHSNSIPFAATKADIVAPHKNFVEMHAKGTGVFGPKGVFTLRAAAADAARAADAAHAAAAARAAAASGADAAYAATDTDMPDAPAGLANIVDVSAPAPAAASAATMPAPAPAAASAAATTTAASQRDGDIRDFFFKSKPKKSSRREPSSPSKRPAQRPRSESTETAGESPSPPAESAEQLAERRAAAAGATAAAEGAVDDLQQRIDRLRLELVEAQKTLKSKREYEASLG